MENLFIEATALKLRFATVKGKLMVEDLWDLPLTPRSRQAVCLDDIAKSLNSAIKEDAEESFVVKTTKKNEPLLIAFEIVKYIIKVKLAEKEQRSMAKEKADKKKRILSILNDKENKELEGKSREELLKELESL